MAAKIAALIAILLLEGCTAFRSTSPQNSAEEQLLITTAADRAAEALASQVPKGLTAWIDVHGLSREDRSYGLAAIEDALLRHGVKLVGDRKDADAVILPRVGMLSTAERSRLFGIPSLPLPLAPNTVIPALSFYSNTEAKGSAKLAASVYDAKSGQLIISTDPSYGFSHEENGSALFLFVWRKNDLGVNFGTTPPRVEVGSGPASTAVVH